MFRILATLTAILCLALFGILAIAPGSYVQTYGVAADAGAEFLGRRASPMFAGLAVVLWLGRNAPQSPLRSALCVGMAVMWAGIAGSGIFAYLSQGATAMILAAAVVECGFAAGFVIAAREPMTLRDHG